MWLVLARWPMQQPLMRKRRWSRWLYCEAMGSSVCSHSWQGSPTCT